MKKYKKLASVVAVIVVLSLAVGSVAYMFSGSAKVVVEGDYIEAVGEGEGRLGALASPYIYTPLYANAGLTVATGLTISSGSTRVAGDFNKTGANLNASTSLTVALTLTAAQVCDSNVVRVNSAVTATTHNVAASIDVTLPATSTLFADCLSTEGDLRTFIFCNQSPTAATTTQIVTGTGVKLTEPDGQNVEIGGGACAKIEIQRAVLSGTENAIANVDEWIDAD